MAARSPAPSRISSRTLQVLAAAVVMAGASPDEMVTLPMYGVAILAVPPVVGRLCRHRFGPLQRAWVSVGLAVHPVGALYDLYGAVWWYDHLAHAASASLVVGLSYLVVSALVGAGRSRDVPAAVHAVVVGALVVAGVGWEVFELQVAYLRVHGPEDTLADMAYNLVGWLVVAPRWRSLLSALPDRLGERFASASGPTRSPAGRPSRFSPGRRNHRQAPDGSHQTHHPLHRRRPRRGR